MSFKEIENGEFIVENWKECKLGDIADVLSGYAFKSKDFVDKGIPVIKIKNIIPPIIDITDVEYVNEELYDEKQRYALEYNDVLISMTGSNVNQIASAVGKIGRVRLKNTKMLLNQRVGKLYITDKDQCDYNYLYYYLIQEEVRYNLAASAGGSANQANISPNQIKDINIKLPSIKEQKAIAHILSNLDEKIETNNQINKKLEEMAKAIFKQWFIGFEFPNEDGEPYKSSGGEMVESELGMIPKGWRVGNMNDMAEVTDYVANGSFASLKENVQYCEEECGFAMLIRLVDYNNNFRGPYVWVDEKGYNFLKKSKLFGGEIIISNVGANAGTVFKAPKLNKPMTLGPNSIMIMDNKYSNYLYYYLNSKVGQENLNGIITGSAQPKFNKTHFRNIKLIIPNEGIINKLNVFIEPVVNKIEQVELEIKNLITIREILLPKLMSGEIRVQLE